MSTVVLKKPLPEQIWNEVLFRNFSNLGQRCLVHTKSMFRGLGFYSGASGDQVVRHTPTVISDVYLRAFALMPEGLTGVRQKSVAFATLWRWWRRAINSESQMELRSLILTLMELIWPQEF